MYKLKGDTVIEGDLYCPVLHFFSVHNDPEYATKYEEAVKTKACTALEKTMYEGDLVLDGDLYVTLDYAFTVKGCYRASAVQPSI
jgi:hypothetical protein